MRFFFGKKIAVVWIVVLCGIGIISCGGGGDDNPTSPGNTGVATLHAILCIADHESDIGAASAIDLNSINGWLDEISQNTGLPLNRILLTGNQGNLTWGDLSATMNNLPVGPDDVVIFYYTGHGAANEEPGGSRWPLMVFMDEEIVDFNTVNETLKTKGARFVMTLADCCNNYEWQAKRRAYHRKAAAENYQNLFLNQRGYLVVSASSPGEFSLGGDDGGMFTNQFLSAFYNGVAAGASWQTIMQNAAQEMQGEDENGGLTVFHPQYDINIL